MHTCNWCDNVYIAICCWYTNYYQYQVNTSLCSFVYFVYSDVCSKWERVNPLVTTYFYAESFTVMTHLFSWVAKKLYSIIYTRNYLRNVSLAPHAQWCYQLVLHWCERVNASWTYVSMDVAIATRATNALPTCVALFNSSISEAEVVISWDY